ncbi:hypothetical protein RHMOL_Rhmol10G0187700 [Rhododendron molle]|uniref:Uncharacterized protein n=1 Tax=Rhododendron molle TaxID=49168 RepID=A0ACC0M5D1_RHOML|nr:hypothetical protein RHMOL_Rhmol10G0187700 [Rhododendron molle]
MSLNLCIVYHHFILTRVLLGFVGDLIGIPNLPAFANPSATGRNILRGVNYASAAAGILDETGQNLGQRFTLSQQVENFEKTLNQLRNKLSMSDEELSHYLSKALVVMTLGSNDYINNYLVPSMYPTSFMYNPKDYADLLIERYARQILVRLDLLTIHSFLLEHIRVLIAIFGNITAKCYVTIFI